VLASYGCMQLDDGCGAGYALFADCKETVNCLVDCLYIGLHTAEFALEMIVTQTSD